MTNKDFLELLLEKYSSLIDSCKLFDDNKRYEAKELSAKIRTLLHDTKKTTSLLSLLRRKNKILFYDSGKDFDPENLLSTHSLVRISYSGKFEYEAKLSSGDEKKLVSFNSWWEKIIISDGEHRITRKFLVLKMANNDGGVHVEGKLQDEYASITKSNSVGWKIIENGSIKDLDGIHLFSMRQIAHEIIITLGESFPELRDKFQEYQEYLIDHH